jgi:hypothetical protein
MIYRHVLMPEDTKFNQRTKVLPGKEKARCFWRTTLSKKGRGVKKELDSPLRRLIRFQTGFTAVTENAEGSLS